MGIKVQTVSFCSNCHELLPKRCAKCVKHPNRKPRIVEVFGAPKILDRVPCGCVKLLCQRPECVGTMWRQLRADGTLKGQNHFCSRECRNLVTAAARKTRVRVACFRPSCGKTREVHQSTLKVRQHIYCDQRCHYIHRSEIAMSKKKNSATISNDALYYCERCKDITLHKNDRVSYKLICQKCTTGVREKTASVTASEAVSLAR